MYFRKPNFDAKLDHLLYSEKRRVNLTRKSTYQLPPKEMGVMATKLEITDQKETSTFHLLDLPVEIRLQIYLYLRPTLQVKHAHLSPTPAYPPPTTQVRFLFALGPIGFPDLKPPGKGQPHGEQRQLISALPSRKRALTPRGGQGCGYIPSALQRSCKQVYEECRNIPWEENEFVFINWFCSGVYAARSFLKSLQPWQRERMRYARLEVLGRDLKDSLVTAAGSSENGTDRGEWNSLCSFWGGGEFGAGLWGLRLGIRGRVEEVSDEPSDEGLGRDFMPTGEEGIELLGEVDGELTYWQPRVNSKPRNQNVLDIEAPWITAGIALMTNLRWLELEIEDDQVETGAKVQFCLDLERKLGIDVFYVERMIDESQKKSMSISAATEAQADPPQLQI